MNQRERILKSKQEQRQELSDRAYYGRPPVYANVAKLGEPDRYVKVKPGIPFVRLAHGE